MRSRPGIGNSLIASIAGRPHADCRQFCEGYTITSMATYRVILRHSEEGYSVSCPGLPGYWSQGATEEEALANIQVAIREYVEVAKHLTAERNLREDDISA